MLGAMEREEPARPWLPWAVGALLVAGGVGAWWLAGGPETRRGADAPRPAPEPAASVPGVELVRPDLERDAVDPLDAVFRDELPRGTSRDVVVRTHGEFSDEPIPGIALSFYPASKRTEAEVEAYLDAHGSTLLDWAEIYFRYLGEEPRSGRTDEHGELRLTLTDGRWAVLVDDPTWILEGKRELEIGADVAGVPLEVVVGPAGSVDGYVYGPNGEALVGAHVFALESRPGSWLAFDRILARPVRTDARGGYVLSSVPAIPGLYVAAVHEGLAPGGSGTVRLEAGERVSAPPILLEPGAALDLTVSDWTSGEPIEAFVVELRPRAPYSFGFVERPCRDAEGTARIPDLAPGTYDLTVAAEGFRKETRQVLFRGSDTLATTVELSPRD